MSGDVEFGQCELCGREAELKRRYYHYDIKCDCHSPNHFELVRHCADCTPKPPEKTTVTIKPMVTL
jgi:hypothetical protein